MMSSRVLHLLATAHEQGASISRIVRTLAHSIDPDRYQIAAWFLGGPGPMAAELADSGIAVRTFDWNARRDDVAGAWRFWRALRRDHFAIVHLHFGGRAAPLVVRSGGNAKIVLHLHYDGAEAGRKGPIHVRPWMADEVIALSQAVASHVSGMTPRVVYCGIEACGEPKQRPDLNTLVVGAAGRLVPIKGIVYLIRAIALLREELPAVRLEIAGAGAERQSLEQEAHRLGLRTAVEFVGWQRDIWPWLARWDVFVQPSLGEGFGMAALEAMTAGLPVVGTRAGGLPELIDDGCTGYLVPPADVVGLAARLRDLLLDADRRRAMGTAGHTRVRRQFSAERMAADITAVYDQLLGNGGPTRFMNRVTIGAVP